MSSICNKRLAPPYFPRMRACWKSWPLKGTFSVPTVVVYNIWKKFAQALLSYGLETNMLTTKWSWPMEFPQIIYQTCLRTYVTLAFTKQDQPFPVVSTFRRPINRSIHNHCMFKVPLCGTHFLFTFINVLRLNHLNLTWRGILCKWTPDYRFHAFIIAQLFNSLRATLKNSVVLNCFTLNKYILLLLGWKRK